MKKSLSSILTALLFYSTTFAQIPNAGFENWTTVSTYEIPNQWGTMNNATATFSVYTALKNSPGSPGSFFLNLTSQTTGSTVTNGIAVSGVLDTINKKAKSGFACTAQPISLTGKWQHMIFGTSQGSVKAVLTKWNVSLNKRDTVAIAAQTLSGMAMSWANFTINFTYLSGVVPDSCIIDLRASGSAPTNSDYLYIDNLAFSGSVTGLETNNSFLNSVVLYPNPSTESVNLCLNLKTFQQITIELADISGKIIRSKNAGMLEGESIQIINVSGIARGTYLLKIIGETGSETKRIILE